MRNIIISLLLSVCLVLGDSRLPAQQTKARDPDFTMVELATAIIVIGGLASIVIYLKVKYRDDPSDTNGPALPFPPVSPVTGRKIKQPPYWGLNGVDDEVVHEYNLRGKGIIDTNGPVPAPVTVESVVIVQSADSVIGPYKDRFTVDTQHSASGVLALVRDMNGQLLSSTYSMLAPDGRSTNAAAEVALPGGTQFYRLKRL